jgi:hypothetical protein
MEWGEDNGQWIGANVAGDEGKNGTLIINEVAGVWEDMKGTAVGKYI